MLRRLFVLDEKLKYYRSMAMALRRTSYIRTCQPLPVLRKCSTISASNLAVNWIFGRSDFGRPRRGASKVSTVSGGNSSASASHPVFPVRNFVIN